MQLNGEAWQHHVLFKWNYAPEILEFTSENWNIKRPGSRWRSTFRLIWISRRRSYSCMRIIWCIDRDIKQILNCLICYPSLNFTIFNNRMGHGSWVMEDYGFWIYVSLESLESGDPHRRCAWRWNVCARATYVIPEPSLHNEMLEVWAVGYVAFQLTTGNPPERRCENIFLNCNICSKVSSN